MSAPTAPQWISSEELHNMGGRWVRITGTRTHLNGKMDYLIEFMN